MIIAHTVKFATDMRNLKILKASAGSGKTYNLTKEYLNLIEKEREIFSHILAVTFTNKATEEMKHRVIKELHKKSLSDPVAKERLIEILHNYSNFNISTIDGFFQQIMRSFAREIGKSGSYNVELDDNLILVEAVEMMLQDLDIEENEELLNWLVKFSIDAIEDGKSWDIKKGIIPFAQQMFKEAFRAIKSDFKDSVNNKITLQEFISNLDGVIKKYEDEILNITEDVFRVMERYSLSSESFKGGTRSKFKFYDKTASGDYYSVSPNSLMAFTEDFDNWFAKSVIKSNPVLFDSICNAYNESLRELVERTVSLQNDWIEAHSAILVRSRIYILGILIDINKNIQRYSKEHNIMLLSDTTEILNNIIDGSDSPFIFEKIGSRIDHFMLDEFQDTSLMQWNNFKPLIKNSLASGNSNLVVGDVKQSIYRWRGSDWSLLNTGIYNDFGRDNIEESVLEENWRSYENIVNFNNRFFKYAANQCDILIGDSITAQKIYSDCEQKVCRQNIGNSGHVKVKFIQNEEKKWKENVLNELPLIILKFRENGYSFKDIACLVRTNKDGVSVVNKLVEKGFPVISNESLLITSSRGVRKVISILRGLVNKNDLFSKAIAELEGIKLDYADDILRLPLYEICERVVESLEDDIHETDHPYIQGFMDAVLDFLTNNSPDLNLFLEWFDKQWYKLSLSSPEEQNAIRVMTIHKSKGLGIRAVIVPFFDLELDHAGNPIIWCKPDRAPFDSIPFLPVSYKKELEDTIFSADYKMEKQKSYIDNLNLAYVAFTRAREELVVYAPLPSERGTNASLANILYNLLKEELNSDLEFSLGEWCRESIPENSRTTTYYDNYNSVPPGDRLRLSLRAGEFFDKESKRNYGLIMHDILSGVYYEKDLPNCVKKAVAAGEISADEEIKILDYLTRMMESVGDRHWFDFSYTIYNELEILSPGGGISRPDRVLLGDDKAIVIDFKFGNVKDSSYIKQVSKYKKLIEKITGKSSEGYIWYLEDNDIVEVK